MAKQIEQRPPCPKCGMHMIVVPPVKGSQRGLECLRCGHTQKKGSTK